MGNTTPILSGTIAEWEDGKIEYGMADPRDGTAEMFVLAHRSKRFKIKRKEDGEKIPSVENRYELYNPEELSLYEHDQLLEDGYHIHKITEADLIQMLQAGFDGRSCGE